MSVFSRNNVNVSGCGTQTVILAHGFGIDQQAWRLVLPRFEEHYKVVRYDLTGLGRSELSAYDRTKYRTLHGHADDLLEICQELELSDAFFVGHSVSAMIGVLAANRQPARFRKLALVAGSPCYLNLPDYQGGLDRAQAESVVRAVANDYLGWCDATVPMAVDASNGPEITREVMQSFKRVDPEIAHHLAHVIFLSDHRGDLPDVQIETYVLQASRDAFVPENVARYIAERVPRAQFALLPGVGGHYPHLGSPDAVFAALQTFLTN